MVNPKNGFLEKIVEETIERLETMGEKIIGETIMKEAEELNERIRKKDSFFVQIAGNIGMGKTTVARIIVNQTRMDLIEEDPDDQILKKYYNDMYEWAYLLQIHLISYRLHQIAFQRKKSKYLISDRTPYEDPLIFASALHQSGIMKEEEFKRVLEYFDLCRTKLEKDYQVRLEPDLIILVSGSEELGWKRVNGRARSMEIRRNSKKGVGLTREFYQQLHRKYQSFPSDLKENGWYDGPLMVLRQDKIDISDINNLKGWIHIIRCLKEAVSLDYV